MDSGLIVLWSWRAAALVLQSCSPPVALPSLVARPGHCSSLQPSAAALCRSEGLSSAVFWPRSAVSLEHLNWALVWPVDGSGHLCLCRAAVSGIQLLTAVPQLSQALVRLRAYYTLGAADGTLFPVQQGRGRLNNSYISSELAANTGTACLGTRQ